jgi:hypothetical protein
MSKIAYADQRFTADGLAVIEQAERYCAAYARQGYELTLRQLYYRFIAEDTLPESRRDKELGTKNTERNYKWLGDLVSKARTAGLIDWSHIVDRTRRAAGGDQGWSSPEAAVASVVDWYTISKWVGQRWHVEVWVEKEALVDVISQPAARWNVTYMACKGSPSTSVMHQAAQRLRRHERAGKKTLVIYLGDFDPTGLDIDRDIRARLALFGSVATVTRVGLTQEQIEDLDPPPSPAKATDSRTPGYVDDHPWVIDDDGTERCWELDALEPATLEQLVEDAILDRLDRDGWDARVRREEREKDVLRALPDNWDGIMGYLREIGALPATDEDDES